MKSQILTGAGLFFLSLSPLFLMIKQDSLADTAASLAFVMLFSVILAQAFDLVLRNLQQKGVK